MNKILFLISILFLFSCGNKPNKKSSDCENLYADEKIELCLPSKNWKPEKIEKYLIFKNDSNDSLTIDKSVIAIMIDDYQSELSAKDLRNQHLESMLKSETLNVKLISKGTENINGNTFYDFEVNSKDGQVYSYFLFYNKGKIGYNISASIGEEIRNGIDKKDYLNFLKSLRIK
ncbi:MAG: hypothetical protein R3342_13090 [Lutibacter sp.]|uniref:hypothetical protein n=1 Tax=Lutibacter sp. TaxID=1925666 RepID=UPI00299ED371|nr:hypothetical protein [Lutibacter sp.]MDX1830468.1 hypothetical protein [Lutibacter sp.]